IRRAEVLAGQCPLFDLPGMIDGVPRDTAHEVTRKPAFLPAWPGCGDVASDRGRKPLDNRSSLAPLLLGQIARLIQFELPAERRQVPGLGSQDVPKHRLEVTSAAAWTLLQGFARCRVRRVVERLPA